MGGCWVNPYGEGNHKILGFFLRVSYQGNLKFDIISGNGVFANIIDANSGEDIVAKPACLICMWRQHSMCLKVWKFKFQNFSVERRRRWRERSDTGSCSV